MSALRRFLLRQLTDEAVYQDRSGRMAFRNGWPNLHQALEALLGAMLVVMLACVPLWWSLNTLLAFLFPLPPFFLALPPSLLFVLFLIHLQHGLREGEFNDRMVPSFAGRRCGLRFLLISCLRTS